MLFDIGLGELLIIGVVGLIILGPDRLPTAAAQAARFLRQLREQLSDARATMIEAADIDATTLKDLKDLDPRNVARDLTAPINEVRQQVDETAKTVENDLRDIS